MSKYYSFNDFMSEVVEAADAISEERSGCSLEDLYKVSTETRSVIHKLLSLDWKVYVAVVALFVFGEFGIAAAVAAFLLTPLGIPVMLLLGACAAKTIMHLYHEKVLPNAVKAIGERYRISWEAAEGNREVIDALTLKAAEELYSRAAA